MVGTIFGWWSTVDNLRGVLTRGEAIRSSSNSNSSLGLKSRMIDIERSLCAGLVMIAGGGVVAALRDAPSLPPDAPPRDAPLASRDGSDGAAAAEALFVPMLDNDFDSA